MRSAFSLYVCLLLATSLLVAWVLPANGQKPLPDTVESRGEAAEGLSEARAEEVSQAVDQALAWMAEQQQPDGKFPGPEIGQPGITSLSVLAFLSAGHLPGEGPYGEHLERAIEYALGCEVEEGLFCVKKPGPVWAMDKPSHTATYNQAVTALMFAEVSGEVKGQLGKKVTAAVERSLLFSSKLQFLKVPGRPQDEGGWRYTQPCPLDDNVTDLSITAWQVSFLRSAKNAGFDVDEKMIEAARKYVQSLYHADKGTFTYDHKRMSRGMTGAGIWAMAMLGQHQTKETKAAAAWLRKHPFGQYGEREGFLDRFQYSVYYCTQALYQLGGEDWQEFYPQMVDLLLENQTPGGSWPAVSWEVLYGDNYVTALSVLSLTTPYSMLPIHQR